MRWVERVADVVVPQRKRAGEVRRLAKRLPVHEDVAVVALLVEHGENGGSGRGGDRGYHDVLYIVVQEEPRLLPGERLSERVCVLHSGNTYGAVGDAAHEGVYAGELGIVAVKWRGVVIDGCSRDY